jgi:hypothetical protein
MSLKQQELCIRTKENMTTHIKTGLRFSLPLLEDEAYPKPHSVVVAKKIKIFSDMVELLARESLEHSSGMSNVRLRKVSNVPVGCRTFSYEENAKCQRF